MASKAVRAALSVSARHLVLKVNVPGRMRPDKVMVFDVQLYFYRALLIKCVAYLGEGPELNVWFGQNLGATELPDYMWREACAAVKLAALKTCRRKLRGVR